MSVTVIAEAGVNHNGRLDVAMSLVDAAADAGADVVKFQTFRAEELVTAEASQAEYQMRNTGRAETQFAMLKALELDGEAHGALLKRCRSRGIAFLSTPFDDTSLHLLVDVLRLTRLKVGSGDLTNAPLLLKIARLNCDVILSTGMANLEEIDEALGTLAFGYTSAEEACRRRSLEALASEAGRGALREKVTILHCISDYPARDEEINLRAIETLADRYDLPVGFSDHSTGIAVPIAAVARGATCIEKHLTLDRSMPGPDHAASIEPAAFKAMVAGIRQVELALGDGKKHPTPSERKTMAVARKSVVARRPIRAGEVFSSDNLAVKRPGTGLPPINLWALIGRAASRDYAIDDLIAELPDSSHSNKVLS